ncbi:MAG: Ig-like domain-containing protein, partial [Bacilli bacterium]|nr:Ig-like domain-containing protein [Bacilli bacterium]
VNKTLQLSATLVPSNHTMTNKITWTSSNSNVASVDSNGKVTAHALGTAVITGTTVNGKKATGTIIVKAEPTKDVAITEQMVLKHFGLTKKSGYVTGFALGSDVAKIKKLLISYKGVTLKSFKNADGKEINTGLIATGMKFTLYFNNTEYHYIVVVKGDVNGDGYVYATDYVCIKNYIMGIRTLTGAYLYAADVNNDNHVYATDYVKIRNYIMGKSKTL